MNLTVHDSNDDIIADVKISGTWSGGASGNDACFSDLNGRCSETSPPISNSNETVTFTVDSVSHATLPYDPSTSRTAIMIHKP